MILYYVPYRDYDLHSQNIEELHAIIDHQGFSAVIGHLAITSHMHYSEGQLFDKLKDLAESKDTRMADERLLRRAMENFQARTYRPLHSHLVDPNIKPPVKGRNRRRKS